MNHLSKSASPYLLQHAHNPVDWYPWGDEALARAKTEDKPIFLSIGYAACHWCHVMAHESFEDPKTAAYMNEHFINIKVDREERPDIDEIYTQATVAMIGSGGWPMSVFLAPDLKPFYAGIYFPPVRRYNMPAFKDVLSGLANAWINDRSVVEKVGEQIISHLQHQNKNEKSDLLTPEHFDAIANSMADSYDWGYGGWGSAPKFPQAMTIEFLLQHAAANNQTERHKLIAHCLDAMARGGFPRYSTDNFWRFFDSFNGLRSRIVSGRGQCLGAGKTRSQPVLVIAQGKMLETRSVATNSTCQVHHPLTSHFICVRFGCCGSWVQKYA